jgi:O-antigen/teichoic acid export membrane protein
LIILASLCNLVLNFILISILIKISPTWAIRGAAIATVISWIFYFILALRKFEKDFKTKIPKGPFFSSIFSSTLMFITLLFLKQYFQEINLANGIALIFSGIIIYLLGLLIIGEIKKEDFTILKLIANRN